MKTTVGSVDWYKEMSMKLNQATRDLREFTPIGQMKNRFWDDMEVSCFSSSYKGSLATCHNVLLMLD
jgi:hypothetical protein